MVDLIIKNAQVVTASDIFICDIGINKEKITFLEKDTKHKSQKIIDANNNFVLPGGIDAHCHIDQPMKDGSVMADNFETGSLSAAFGGTTTIIPFACQYKGESLREVIKDYHQRAENKSYIDYAFHTIISDVNKKVLGQELPAIIKDGYSHFKIYMTYEDLKLNDKDILNILEIAGKEKAVVMVHAENDDCISWLTEKLEEKGKLDNTLIIITSDHGDFNHGKATNYEGGIKVPMLMYWKNGITTGTTYQELVQNIDLAPTILDLAGANLSNSDTDGQSLKNVIVNNSTAPIHDYLFFELGFSRAIRTKDWKYITVRYELITL